MRGDEECPAENIGPAERSAGQPLGCCSARTIEDTQDRMECAGTGWEGEAVGGESGVRVFVERPLRLRGMTRLRQSCRVDRGSWGREVAARGPSSR